MPGADYAAVARVAQFGAQMHSVTAAGRLLHWTRTAAWKSGNCRAVAAYGRQPEALDGLLASLRAGHTADSGELQRVLAGLAVQKRYVESREVLRLASDAGAADSVQLWQRLLDEIRMNGTRAQLQWAEKDMHETLSGERPHQERLEQQAAAGAAKAARGLWPDAAGPEVDPQTAGATPWPGANTGHVDGSKFTAADVGPGREEALLVEMDEMAQAGAKPTAEYFLMAMKRAKRNPQLAEKVWANMITSGLRPTEIMLYYLASAYWWSGRPLHAVERYSHLLRKFQIPATKLSFNALILAHSLAGRLDVARRLLNSMVDVGMRATVRTYNSLMTGPAREGDFEFVEAAIEQMDGAGIAPNEASLGLLIQALAVRGEGEQARLVLDTMQKTHRIAPNEVHCTLVVEALCKQGGRSNIEAAERFLQESNQRSIDSYIPLTRWYSRLRDVHSVRRVIRQLALEFGGTVPKPAFKALRSHLVRARHGITEVGTRRDATKELQRLLEAPGAVD